MRVGSGAQDEDDQVEVPLEEDAKAVLANLRPGEKVVGLLRKVRERFGTTIVLVTHDESVAAAADRVVRISDGRVVDGKE